MQPVEPCLTPDSRYARHNRRFAGIPGIEVTSGGRLWVTWYAGGDDEGPENYVLLVTSDDQGASWSPPKIVVDPPGNVRAFDPGLWIDPLGRLWWYWSQSHAHPENSCYDGRAGVWFMRCDTPEGSDAAWTPPRWLANGIMMNKPIVTSAGAWLFPAAVWTRPPLLPELCAERFSNVIESLDAGETFRRKGGADVPERTFDEHMLVERKDGSLWMTVRTSYGIGQSFSTDGGANWTPGEPSALPCPSSRFFLRRLASGRLLFIGHDAAPEADAPEIAAWAGRSHLTAWLSEDDGASWQGAGLLLDARRNVSYPDAAQAADGRIFVIYDCERKRLREILVASFREEDVLDGKLISADTYLGRRIPA